MGVERGKLKNRPNNQTNRKSDREGDKRKTEMWGGRRQTGIYTEAGKETCGDERKVSSQV